MRIQAKLKSFISGAAAAASLAGSSGIAIGRVRACGILTAARAALGGAALTMLVSAAYATPAVAAGRVDLRGAASYAPSPPCKIIFLSDKTTAADYRYLSFTPWTPYAPLPQLPAVDNGWGLWATSDLLYAGEAPNKINIYKPCENELGFSLTATGGAGPPLSIAVDTTHNYVYATEFTTPTIDWFAGATDTPGPYDSAPRAGGLPYYLAVDNVGNVYVSGWGSAANTNEQIDVCAPGMIGCHACEVLPNGTWPGGVTLDKFQNLIVNSETGTLFVFHPSCGALASSYVYSTGNFTFTDITLDTSENRVWGANQFDVSQPGCTSPFCMDAQAVAYFPSLTTPVIGPLLPPVHTTPIRHSQQPGGGIAIWPPGPI